MDRTNQVDGAGEEDEDEDLQSMALQSALKALPFYLSNADFVPELEEELGWLSEYLLLAEVSETQELQQSLDLYQRVSLFVGGNERLPDLKKESTFIKNIQRATLPNRIRPGKPGIN